MSNTIFVLRPVRQFRPRAHRKPLPRRASIESPEPSAAPALAAIASPVMAVAAALAMVPARELVASSNDAPLVAILDSPLFPGETARDGFHRKEAELRAVIATLPVAAQRALHARLSNLRAGDPLSERFGRLTADRRTRLLTFLADARRREARTNNR